MDLDLLVIGSGPGGQRAAIQAAKLGKRVGVVERRDRIGGVSIHSGTIPSKSLRQSILESMAARGTDLADPLHPEREGTARVHLLHDRVAHVIANETAVVREQLRRNGVGLLIGSAAFEDPHTVHITGCDEDGGEMHVSADKIVIAVGTNPARPSGVDFDDRRVIDSDGVLGLDYAACKTMTIVGGGVIGIEYTSMFAAMGVRVTLVDARDRLLPFVDRDIGVSLRFLLRKLGVTFRFGEEVVGVERRADRVVCRLRSGKEIVSDTLMYATGRQGATDGLALENAGLECDQRGRVEVDREYRTAVEHIFAVGDVAGPPGLAATSMEQGRIAALAAFEEPVHQLPELVPIGIYSIPEISYVGRTEEELTEASIPYVAGVAWWRELAKAMMLREEDGLLKILVSPEDRRLLGVHVIGTQATDLVHIGQALMDREAGLDFLVSAVFNYPTLAEAYKVAGLDALNRMRDLR
ncbi:MAG TPA: Si-specific NAD(P)(+) transhydrogenase [Solirubrobacteraceae bacterium]|nr:Si-specific NAD(P)(+) transhydrogenase [Solirubrobacteraceae bacterium]